ncbi:hypothetical protein [Butyrivibrio sp. YAB3001]|uniref:hypothetical protein n=1 Tax=Butyrivibrio sp. YAB3001 TaxID=1520812 RepID=UPI0008F657F7|nr:hypothetical protein [Butyrivibrio sp. YAB3001]SFB86931.1 hypothetical protein SAMN02910398_00936 [Butyrivibrio sp. YAB3001]
MARQKKKKQQLKSFESICSYVGDKFTDKEKRNQTETMTRISESMLCSDSFKSLKPRQQMLYIYCKAQYYGKRKPKDDNTELYQDDSFFYMNWGKILDYGLYTEKSHSNFYKDMQELEKKGFIKKVESGKNNRKKNIYQYVDKWVEK